VIGNSPLAIRYSLPFNHSPLAIRYSLPSCYSLLFYSPFAIRYSLPFYSLSFTEHFATPP
jgi:hypothetical protein